MVKLHIDLLPVFLGTPSPPCWYNARFKIWPLASVSRGGTLPQKIAIIGGGVAGLGAAWALSKHPDRFDIRLFEANDRLGGNAITVDMPQEDGRSIPFDISVTACIPSVYHNYIQFMQEHDIPLVPTRFS